MTDRLRINGWMVAEADLEHGYDPYNAFDPVCVFRNPGGWSTLTVACDVRNDDHDRPISGTATITTSEFAGGLLSTGTEIVGALVAGRYGYQGAILVRVDDCGEIYARLAEDGDTDRPALRPLTTRTTTEAAGQLRSGKASCRRCPAPCRAGRRGGARPSGSSAPRECAAPRSGAARPAAGCRGAPG
jgi:hypothetical protein